MKCKRKEVKKSKRITIKKKNYTQESINKALREVENGMSSWKAAKLYSVPRSTIYTKVKGTRPVEGVKGPATCLSKEEEDILVDWILYCSVRGFPITKSQLCDCVKKLITELGRETPFKNGTPGRHWFEGFCRRHPQITQRVAQNLNASRAAATESALRNWFSEVETHLQNLNLINIDASRIYNLDESAFFLIPKADKVLARKGSKAVYKVVSGSEKESITVLFTVNAEGTMLPPMILYWYERMPAAIINSLPSHWICGNTERGWMTAESFYSYVKDQFHPWLIENKIQFPVILYVDGHASHLTLPLSKFCREKQIEVIALYPNATHVLQPLDVAVFHPLITKWKKTVDQWRVDNIHERMKKEHFAPLLKKALDAMTNLSQTIQHGFAACGLSPFCADSVNYNILSGNKKNISQDANSVNQEGVEKCRSTDKEDEARIHLKFFEKTINPEILNDFRNTVACGSVDVRINNEGLFNYWLDLKRLSGDYVSDSLKEKTNFVHEPVVNCQFSNSNSLPLVQTDFDVENFEIIIVPEDNKCSDMEYLSITGSEDLLSDKVTTCNELQTSFTGSVMQLDTDSTICIMESSTETTILNEFNSLDDIENTGFLEDAMQGHIYADVVEQCTPISNDISENLNPESIDTDKKTLLQDDTQEHIYADIVEPCQITYEISTDTGVLDLSLKKTASCTNEMERNSANISKQPLKSALKDVGNTLANIVSDTKTNCGTNDGKENDLTTSVPSPFKRSLIWPTPIPNKRQKKVKKKKILPVLTCEEWVESKEVSENEKIRKQQEVEERKKKREEAKLKKAQDKEAKKIADIKKRKLNEEIKKLMEEKKKLTIKTEKPCKV